jgi:hypothetical protein
MTYGAQVFNAAGGLIWDSTTAGSGVVADVLDLAPGGPYTFTYPSFAGRTVNTVSLEYLGATLPTMDTALGYPRVTVPADFLSPRMILVVAF